MGTWGNIVNRSALTRTIGALVAVALATLMLNPPAAFARGPGQPPTSSCSTATIYKADGSAWQCTFDDEFNGNSLDTSKWVPQLTSASGSVSGPSGSQTCYVNSPNNISEAGGVLNLTVRKENSAFTCATPNGSFSTRYTAGSVSGFSKFSQTYGRVEVRAKYPQTKVPGLQSTLWLWPVNSAQYGTYPSSGEIDFSEWYSQYASNNIPFIHYVYDPNTANASTNTNIVTSYGCTIDNTVFNTYAVVWQPGTITLYTNGKACVVDNYRAAGLNSPAPFDQPFFLALTSALGVGSNAYSGSTALPATTQVDYVRIWK